MRASTPVSITKTDWPIVAEAVWGNQRERALVHDWTRRWRLVIRQHADGRTIVYGVFETKWATEDDRRAGELLTAYSHADQLAAAERVAEAIGAPEHLVDTLLADLPAEQLA